MKNIINEKPITDAHGRTLLNVVFVDQKDYQNKKMLDIGCGMGWFELIAVLKGCDSISGIEISEQDLLTAKKNINNNKIYFKVGKATQIPYKDHLFDVVVSWEVIEHIPEQTENKMFQEVNRVLKVGGSFYLSTPYSSILGKVSDPAWWLLRHRHYSDDQLINFGKINGFRVDKIIVKGGFWEMLSIINLYSQKWLFRRRPLLEQFMTKKVDKELLSNDRGFIGISVKYTKIKTI